MTLFEKAKIVIGLLALAGIAWIVYDFAKNYLSYSGSRWTRFLYAFDASLTIIWSRFVIVISLISTSLASFAGYLGLPEVQSAFNAYLTAQNAALLIAGIAVVTEICRRRTL